ncbi:type I restriction endonuclease subunit R [Reticulibacter mediterranei]|nr:HsdR family type I site-specific deoxyribonuclease [Reticulibacter mediterranei]
MQQFIDTYTWQIAQVLDNRRATFILWAIKTLFCTTKDDFLRHYKITDDELMPFLNYLTIQGFLQQDGEHYVLTQLGDDTVELLGELSISEFARPQQLSREVTTRFDPTASVATLPASVKGANKDEIAQEFWKDREYDRQNQEATLVELPFIQQLVSQGWKYKRGDINAPEFTGRGTFREVLIETYFREALPKANIDEETGKPWMNDFHVQLMLDTLKPLLKTRAVSLLQTNREATDLLLKGRAVPLTPGSRHTRRAHFIDFAHPDPEHNDFCVINQFRVDLAGNRYIVPDLVLFVNGIPLVVVECRNPRLTNPLEQGISQLLDYARAYIPTSDLVESQAMPELFYFNLLLISTSFFQARFAPLGASYEDFQEWKDPYLPPELEHYRAALPAEPSSQQNLILGVLLPHNLLDLFYNFTLFDTSKGKVRKLIARYHQFRAVHHAILQLQKNPTRRQHGEEDQRGGIIWHTQGSGKSLTMVFLVRKMRTIQKLRSFKIIFVTDRKQLEKQLSGAVVLTDEPISKVDTIPELKPLLRRPNTQLIFAMIQKYRDLKDALAPAVNEDEDQDAAATPADDDPDPSEKAVNSDETVLVIVDEGHRSQTRKLHANLRRMLPNSARIAFTGTPIIRGPGKKTTDIFGDYIDRYTIRQSEIDGATLPIFYEGHEADIEITQKRILDAKYDTLVQPLADFVRASLQESNITYRTILENEQLIEKKAEDILLHYGAHILPNRLKAMVVAVSRLAAILYRNALQEAQKRIIARLDVIPTNHRHLTEEQIELLDESDEYKTLLRILPYRNLLNALDFAAIVSSSPKDDLHDTHLNWSKWTSEDLQDEYIKAFNKPLPFDLASPQAYEAALSGTFPVESPHNDQQLSISDVTSTQDTSPLAFLCVRSMLITGFDAPIAQGLYLDRSIKNHELLQAIARVNRIRTSKGNGLVVDYYGIAQNLKDALDAYDAADVQGALVSIKDEYPLLADRHRRILALFTTRQRDIHQDWEACVELLKDREIRADFEIKLKKFMESMETVLPRPEALNFIKDAQQLGLINLAASSVYRDTELNLLDIGNKVRKLIAEHIDTLQIHHRIPPVDIHDINYQDKLRRYHSDETNAAQMEGFARDYITYYFEQEDPSYYQTLSDQLQSIIERLRGQWDLTVDALDKFIQQITKAREIDTSLNLDARTEYPFFGILEEEARKGSRRFKIAPQATDAKLSQEERVFLAGITRRIVAFISQRLTENKDFWLSVERANELRRDIGFLFLEEYQLLEPFQRREEVASRLVRLALVHTSRLRKNA